MKNVMNAMAPVVILAAICSAAWGQSSSILLEPTRAASPPSRAEGNAEAGLSPHLMAASFVVVRRPPPRKFAKHDLVTVIVRESITSDAVATLETEKSFKKKGKISAIPRLRLQDFLQFQVNQSDLSDGEPEINLEFDTEFDGEGKDSRRNTFTARITARVIDVKPNGTLVLEARKKIKTDNDSFIMVLTGTSRPEDITADNTVLSTELYDMTLVKQHTGTLRKASKKGWLTKFFEVIFNF